MRYSFYHNGTERIDRTDNILFPHSERSEL